MKFDPTCLSSYVSRVFVTETHFELLKITRGPRGSEETPHYQVLPLQTRAPVDGTKNTFSLLSYLFFIKTHAIHR